jgi:uncharacterized protein Usg
MKLKRGRLIITPDSTAETEQLGIIDANVLEPRIRELLEAAERKLRDDRRFIQEVTGYGLTTAQVFYRFPDYQSILYWFLWQEYDTYPKFPRLHSFLDFWRDNLDGPLHSVDVAHHKLVRPREFNIRDGVMLLN